MLLIGLLTILFSIFHKSSDGLYNEHPEVSARKRRRGQIEKKRRDRINSSLAELRQLVPAALQKQGSTKLEKAEILQLTVEHLRGLKYGAEYNPVTGFTNTRAIDERIPGRQECMAEGKPCLSASAEGSETACRTPARRQIINHLNWNTSLQSGYYCGPSPPSTTTIVPTLKTEPNLSAPWQSSSAILSCDKQDVNNNFEKDQDQVYKGKDWRLSVALNYPIILPFQAPGLSNVRRSPSSETVPLIDWSMALITKTKISTPFKAPWVP